VLLLKICHDTFRHHLFGWRGRGSRASSLHRLWPSVSWDCNTWSFGVTPFCGGEVRHAWTNVYHEDISLDTVHTRRSSSPLFYCASIWLAKRSKNTIDSNSCIKYPWPCPSTFTSNTFNRCCSWPFCTASISKRGVSKIFLPDLVSAYSSILGWENVWMALPLYRGIRRGVCNAKTRLTTQHGENWSIESSWKWTKDHLGTLFLIRVYACGPKPSLAGEQRARTTPVSDCFTIDRRQFELSESVSKDSQTR